MSHASNRPPRFLPTLTEVVDPSAVVVSGVAPAPETGATAPSDMDAIIERVMQRLEASLEPRLREWVAQAVAEELHSRPGG